nr:hypothetical protein [Tanacetum cinerariifolium]
MAGDDNHDGDHPETSNTSPPVPSPTQQIPHTVLSMKLPILKKGEYDIWAMKMEHYLTHTNYPIWQVIQNRNGPISVTTDTNRMIKVLPPITVEEVMAIERERKARTTLLMALPEYHLAKFHKMADAKETWKAIKSRFGGNDESKKMQKYLLKQQFEGSFVSTSEGLHKRYDRFQTLLSQLEIHGAGVSHEDANQKFLRSLPCFWSQAALIMRTKPGLDTLSFDDLYNNLRVFKRDVKGTTTSSSNTQNVAFVSTDNTSSTNDVSTAYSVSSPSVSKSQKEGSSSYIDEAIHFFFTNQSSTPQLDYDDLEQINDDDIEEMDLKWQVTIDGEVIDWSGHVEEDAQNYAMMAYSSSNSSSDNKVKSCAKTCEESYARLKKLYDEQRDKLGDASVEITTYTLALKKSVFMNKASDLEDISFNDRYADGMHAVLPPMTGNYMLSRPDVEIDYSKFTYGSKQTSIDESNSKPSENASCESDFSVETTTSIPEPVENDDPHRALKDKGYVDSRCSRHMTGNKAHFADYQEFKGGSIAFGGSNERITGKGKIKAGRFSWVYFLKSKDETTPILKDFIRQAENQFNHKVKTIRSDNETEFKNNELIKLCGLKGIKREYSNARTLQQNGVVKRKNRTLIEAVRTMLADSFLPTTFWAEAVNTACYVLNRVLVTKPQNKTPYELLTVFLVGYSLNNKAFRVYNLETKRVKENLHVNFLENKPNVTGKGHAWMFDLDYLTNSMIYELVLVENQANKSAGPKEANNSASIQANDDQSANSKEINLYEEHFILPIWSSYSTTVKSSGDKIEKNTDFKTCEKPVSQVEQIFLEELEKLKRQEKEANDGAESLSKEATHDIQNANTSSTNLLNIVSTPLSTIGPSRAFNDGELSYPDDPSKPHLKDIYASLSEGIFTNSSYDNEGVVTDFNNLETTMNVSPTPTTRIHTIHPKTQILGDHMSVV